MKKSFIIFMALIGLLAGKVYSQSLNLQEVQEKLMHLTLDFKGNSEEIDELVAPLTVPERDHLFNNMKKTTYGFSLGPRGLSFSFAERMSVFPEPVGSRMSTAETIFAIGTYASVLVLSASTMVFFIELIFGAVTMFAAGTDDFDTLTNVMIVSGISSLVFGIPYLGLETAAAIKNVKNKTYNRKLEKALKLGIKDMQLEEADTYVSMSLLANPADSLYGVNFLVRL